MRKEYFIQLIVLGKSDIHVWKNEIGLCLTPFTKINWKWIKDLNIRPKATKPLEENTGKGSLTLILAIFFFDMTPNTQATAAKINKWDYIKLTSFCTAKETINKMKRQHMGWEKIFANHISDKELTLKIYSWPLNCMSPLIHRLFSIYVYSQPFISADAEPTDMEGWL